MAAEDSLQAGRIVEWRFEREDADHQIEPARHLRNATAIPCPHLRADVIDDLCLRPRASQRFREAQIEAGIIDEEDRIGIERGDAPELLKEFFPEKPVVPKHVGEAHHRGMIDPVLDVAASESFEFRAAEPVDFEVRQVLAQCGQQARSVHIAAGFACDDEEPFHRADEREASCPAKPRKGREWTRSASP